MIAIGFGKCLLVLLQVHVADPLEEHQREDVRLEVRLVDGPAQQVSRRRQVLLQLTDTERSGRSRDHRQRDGACFLFSHSNPQTQVRRVPGVQ